MRVTPEILAAREAVRKARAAHTAALGSWGNRPSDTYRKAVAREKEQVANAALDDFFCAVTAQLDAESGQ